MTQAEMVTACMEQAKLAYSIHNNRRSYEWKVTLGLWAVILGVIVKGLKLPWWVWGLIVLAYGAFWLRSVWVANMRNKDWYEFYMKSADRLLRDPEQILGPMPDCMRPTSCRFWFGFLGDWSMLFQFATTLALAALAYLSGTGVVPIGPEEQEKVMRVIVYGCPNVAHVPQ